MESTINQNECHQVCQVQSEITKGFRLSLAPGTYEFQWKLGSCGNPIFYAGSSRYPPRPGTLPRVRRASADSPTACVHPYPRSLAITSRPDLTLPSPLGDRTIERTYRTGLIGDAVAGDGMFGKGWRANFEYRIGTINGSNANGVMLFDAAGRKIFYQRSNYPSTPVVYASPDGNGGSISSAADGSYLWQDAQGTCLLFRCGRQHPVDRDMHGNQETFGYSGGRITSLTDRHGRVVTFDYQGTNHVRRLLGPAIAANPAGVYATYAYDTNGNLTGVTFPDGNALIYGYENSAWPSHMTRHSRERAAWPGFPATVSIQRPGQGAGGLRRPRGPELSACLRFCTGGFQPVAAEYGLKTEYRATVTEWADANWNFLVDGAEVQTAQRTYYYENRGGADVVTKIEDGGCSCAAEKQYDSAFRVVQSKDNRGVASLMTYNGRGRDHLADRGRRHRGRADRRL